MPRNTDVLCTHCDTYVPRKREQEHRQLINSPFLLPPPLFVSRLHPVIDAPDLDNEDDGSNLLSQHSNVEDTPMETDGGYQEPIDKATTDSNDEHLDPHHNVFEAHWRSTRRATVESDDEESNGEDDNEMDIDEEVANDGEWDKEYINWAAFEASSGLSSWDKLGESFEREAATIGMNYSLYLNVHICLLLYSQSTCCIRSCNMPCICI